MCYIIYNDFKQCEEKQLSTKTYAFTEKMFGFTIKKNIVFKLVHKYEIPT